LDTFQAQQEAANDNDAPFPLNKDGNIWQWDKYKGNCLSILTLVTLA
jgi:hypothetical protein